jgi:hypothetical protein
LASAIFTPFADLAAYRGLPGHLKYSGCPIFNPTFEMFTHKHFHTSSGDPASNRAAMIPTG